jgi:hypothetical protein
MSSELVRCCKKPNILQNSTYVGFTGRYGYWIKCLECKCECSQYDEDKGMAKAMAIRDWNSARREEKENT